MFEYFLISIFLSAIIIVGGIYIIYKLFYKLEDLKEEQKNKRFKREYEKRKNKNEEDI